MESEDQMTDSGLQAALLIAAGVGLLVGMILGPGRR